VFLQDGRCLVRIFKTEDHQCTGGEFFAEAVHIFDINVIIGEHFQDIGQSAGAIVDLHGDNVCDVGHEALFFEYRHCRLGLVDHDTQDAEAFGFSDDQRLDVDIVFSQQMTDLVQPALLVFQENRNLRDFHHDSFGEDVRLINATLFFYYVRVHTRRVIRVTLLVCRLLVWPFLRSVL